MKYGWVIFLAFYAFGAQAAQEEEAITITFRNGAVYQFIPDGPTGTGTRGWNVTRNGKDVAIESVDDGALASETGYISCHDIDYHSDDDSIACTDRSRMAYFTSTYKDRKDMLQLIEAASYEMDDPETKKNEEKAKIVYRRKK